jgi:SAM-dependent methyltransferase
MHSVSPGARVVRDRCPLCGGAWAPVGVRPSTTSSARFSLVRCLDCRYVFVRDPRVDFSAIYDADYYRGRGADASVDYENEMTDPRTVRKYEWRGITRIIDGLVGCGPSTRWMDYGSGLGGLVRYVGEHCQCSIIGFEDGWASQYMAIAGVPHIQRDDIESHAGTFDVVTAVEMLEHTVDPIAVLGEIHQLLKPGGTFFLTTGNAAPHANKLMRWSYTACPDVHVGFFEPGNLADALERTGFQVLWPGWIDGFDDVIRFKVLKSLRVRRTSMVEQALPWRATGRVVDARFRLSSMPAGRRPVEKLSPGSSSSLRSTTM